jgi:hypothetical protein
MSADANFQRPHPNTLRCSDCGHVWFEGERRHHYADERGEVSEGDDAEVVCMLCMQRRRRGAPETDDGEGVRYW